MSPPVVSPPVVGAEEQSEFAFALDEAPRYPVPADKPTGVKISEAYLFWNFATATFVREPK